MTRRELPQRRWAYRVKLPSRPGGDDGEFTLNCAWCRREVLHDKAQTTMLVVEAKKADHREVCQFEDCRPGDRV